MATATKFTGYTALSSTTPQLLGGAGVKMPSNTREILGIVPYVTSPAGNTAGEPVAATVDVQSDDVKPNPYTVLCNPIGSSLLKSVAQVQGKSVFCPMYLKVNGAVTLKFYGTGLFNHTIEPYVGALIIYSDTVTKESQVFSKVSTFTNTGTSAGAASGGTVTIVGGHKLISIACMAVGTTVAALKGLAGYLTISSNEFTPSWTLDAPEEPASGQVDTNIQEAIAGIGRLGVNMAIKPSDTTLNLSHTLSVALTTTGNFIGEFMYN